jgi:cell division protein FtsW
VIYERPYDRWLLLSTLALLGFGALMIYSSTSVITPAMEARNVTEFHYFRRHLSAMAMGLAGMYTAYRVRPDLLSRWSIPLLGLALVLLLLVFVPGIGVKAGGARRWIRLWPTTFQPSELVKLAMVVFLARYMSRPGYRPDRFSHFLLPLGVAGAFQLVFLEQPDFGATVSLAVLTLAMLFLSGVRLRYVAFLVLMASPVLLKLAMEPYRLKRLTSFLNPWKHAQDSGFQLVQSFIALGSGGAWGLGLGRSRQKLEFLPEVHTDFIFSMVGEELGFVVAASLVALFCFIFLRGLRIAMAATDRFTYYLASGLSLMIALQSLVNFGVVTGMLPTKGLPLPFISYGGSSLLINMLAVGLLLNLSRQGTPAPPPPVDDLGVLIERKKVRRSIYGGVR